MSRVRRSRHLISYWRDDRLVTRNYATGHAAIGDALATIILTLCTDWTTTDELRQRVPGLDAEAFSVTLDTMLGQRLLVRESDAEDPRDRALETWEPWNPAAGFFHLSTKNMPVIVDRQAAEEGLGRDRLATGTPAKVKRYAGIKTIDLPPARTKGAFPSVLLRRRTWRSFAKDALRLEDVSTLLNLTWGVQRTVESAFLGPVHLKTSPSSGARQPLEAYMLAVRVDGLRPGLYHYVADEHCLELIARGASSRTIRTYIPGQWWYDTAAALFMMTAVFARTQWRYRFPRAYRSILLEAGHACQTFCLTATWLGLAPFCTGRFSDEVVERDIGADGVTESFIYGAGVGAPPAGVDWAPWPSDSAPDAPLNRRRRSHGPMADE